MKMNREDLARITVETIRPKSSFPLPTRYMFSFTNTPNYNSKRDPRKVDPHCLFHYTIEGEGEYYLNGKLYKVKKGEGFLCIINHPKMSYRYPQNGKEDWKFICLCFNGGNINEVVEDIINNYGPIFPLDEHCQILKKINNLNRNKDTTIISCVEGLRLIWDLLTELINTSEVESEMEYPPIITEIIRLVNQNIKNSINVSEISEKLNISREHISRIFHLYTGKTLKNYIKEKRLQFSCKLLRDGSLTIKEISELLNYSSPSNFSRDFISVMHITPKKFQDLQLSHFIM